MSGKNESGKGDFLRKSTFSCLYEIGIILMALYWNKIIHTFIDSLNENIFTYKCSKFR